MTEYASNNPRLSRRQKILLFLIDGFSEELNKPTAALFHEYLLLLLLKEDIGFTTTFNSYNFKSYSKGIFSEQLRDDLEELLNNNIIDYKDGEIIVTKRVKNILDDISRDPDFKDLITNYKASRKKYNSPYSIYNGTNGYSTNRKIGEDLLPSR